MDGGTSGGRAPTLRPFNSLTTLWMRYITGMARSAIHRTPIAKQIKTVFIEPGWTFAVRRFWGQNTP